MSGPDGKAASRMRKPRRCDSCRELNWPAFGIGVPGLVSEAPPELRSVYLWHCCNPACEADCRSRFAEQLRALRRPDLAAKMLGETSSSAPRPDLPAGAPLPGVAFADDRDSTNPRRADDGSQGALFGV